MKKSQQKRMHELSRRDVLCILKQHGYMYVRSKGDHDMYSNGSHLVPVPRTMNNDKWLKYRILSQCNIAL